MSSERDSGRLAPPAARLPLALPREASLKDIWDGKVDDDRPKGNAKRKKHDDATAKGKRPAKSLWRAGAASSATNKRLNQLVMHARTLAATKIVRRRTEKGGPLLDSMMRHSVYQVNSDPGAVPAAKDERVYRMPRRTDARQRVGGLRVQVRDRTNGQPIAGAALRVQRLDDGASDSKMKVVRSGLNAGSTFGGNTVSNGAGAVDATLLVGTYRIEATCTGFHPFGGLGEVLDVLVEENLICETDVHMVPIKVGVVVTVFELEPCTPHDMLSAAQRELAVETSNVNLSPTKRSRAMKTRSVAPPDRYVTLMDSRSLRPTASYYRAVPAEHLSGTLRIRHASWIEDERTGEVELTATRQASLSPFSTNRDGKTFFFARDRYEGMSKMQRKRAMAHNAARMKKRADDARKDAMEKLRMGDPARLPLEHGNFLSLMVQWGAFFHVGDGACRACGSRKSKDGGPAWTDDDFLVRPPGGKLGKVDASALAQLQKIANNPSMSKISQFVLSNVAPEAEEWEDVLSKPPMPEDDVDSVSARKDMHVKDLPELRDHGAAVWKIRQARQGRNDPENAGKDDEGYSSRSRARRAAFPHGRHEPPGLQWRWKPQRRRIYQGGGNGWRG